MNTYICNPKADIGTVLVAHHLCWRLHFSHTKLLETVTMDDVLIGDTSDNDNSIITLCTSHLLESQKDLYMSLLKIDPLVILR